VILLAVAGLFAAWQAFPDLDRRNGLQLAKEQRFAEAEPYLERALERKPGDVEVLRALALGELAANDLDQAEQHLTRWCALRPREAEPFQHRMDLRLQRRQFPQALEDGQHLLELDPNNQEVGRNVVPLLVITGQLVEAERECRRWLLREPANPNLLYLLADICHQQGNNSEAERILDPLLERQPDSSRALLLRGILYEEGDQPEKAIPLLEKAGVAPDLGVSQQMSALYHLGLVLGRAGKHKEADEAMAKVRWYQAQDLLNRREHPKVPGLLVRVAEAMLGVSPAEEAVRVLEGIPDRDPNCLPEAIRILEKAVQQEPNNAAARQLLDSFRQKQEERKRGLEQSRPINP
jgi:tetratricopeptide (TPR) repeat protein